MQYDVIFEKIVLKNFRCHEDLEFDFIPNRFVTITGDNGCIVGETEIDLPRDLSSSTDGVKIKDLVGQTPYVYSVNNDTLELELKKASEIRKTGEKKEVWKLSYKGKDYKGFTSYDHIITTPDHRCLKSNGKECELKDLVSGDSLMSLYRSENDGYTKIQSTCDNKQYEHKFINESLHGQSMTSIDYNSYHAKWMHDNKPGVFMWNDHPKGMLGKNHTPESKHRISETLKFQYSSGERDVNIEAAHQHLKDKYKNKFYKNKDWLYYMYWVEEKTTVDIAIICNCSDVTIGVYMDKFNIPRRSTSESAKKSYIENKDTYRLEYDERSRRQNKGKLYTDKDWLTDMYQNKKLSTIKISNICNVTAECISYWLTKFNIPKNLINDYNSELLYKSNEWLTQKYIIEGLTSVEMAELINVSDSTIRNWLRKYNIPIIETNHIVTNVEFYGYEDVYNMKVEDNRNFVANGIVIFNSGKSSILDALFWAIYDETTKGRRGDAILRKRSPKNTSVILTFSIGGDQYILENYRKHNKMGSEKILYKNGHTKEHDVSGVDRKDTNKKLVELLMPSKIFKNCLLFSQYVGKGQKSFSESTPGAQAELIDTMLDVDQYDGYRSSVVTKIDTLSNQISSTNDNVPLMRSNLENNNNLLKDEVSTQTRLKQEYANPKTEFESQLVSLREAISVSKQIIKQLPEVEQTVQKLTSDVAVLLTQQSQIETNNNKSVEDIKTQCKQKFNLEKANIEKTYSDKLSEFDQRLTKGNGTLTQQKQLETSESNKLTSEKDKLVFDLDNKYNPLINELDKQTNLLLQEYSNLNVNNNSLNSDRRTVTTEVTDIEFKLKQDNPECYACGQEIKDEALDKVQAQLKNGKSKLTDINKRIGNNEKRMVEIGEKDNVECKNKLTKLNDEKRLKVYQIETKYDDDNKVLDDKYEVIYAKIRKRLDEITFDKEKIIELQISSINKLREDIKEEGSEIQNDTVSKFNSEKLKIQKQIISTQTTLNTESLKLNQLKSNKELHDQNTNSITHVTESLQRHEDTYNVSITESKRRHDNLSTIIKAAQIELDKVDDTISAFEHKLGILEFWKIAYGSQGIKAILLDDAIPIMNERAKELSLLTNCIRVRFSSQSQTKKGEMRNKFSVKVVQTRNLTDDIEDFSGGEGRLVDMITLMSLRYLLEKMYDIRFNIFLYDEILDALDMDNVTLLIGIIRRMSENYTSILISHTLRDWVESDENLSL